MSDTFEDIISKVKCLVGKGDLTPARICQDIAFCLWEFAGPDTKPQVEAMLMLTVLRYNIKSIEITDLINAVEQELTKV